MDATTILSADSVMALERNVFPEQLIPFSRGSFSGFQRLLICVCLAMAVSTPTKASPADDELIRLNKEIARLYKEGKPEAAVPLFKRSIEILRRGELSYKPLLERAQSNYDQLQSTLQKKSKTSKSSEPHGKKIHKLYETFSYASPDGRIYCSDVFLGNSADCPEYKQVRGTVTNRSAKMLRSFKFFLTFYSGDKVADDRAKHDGSYTFDIELKPGESTLIRIPPADRAQIVDSFTIDNCETEEY